eukprot:TRINITY_DN51563_c0_g1_i1.p1 TRINITY_DN51563_c0_g1~~TRINITY_DN51563_c0_g1_i1.p1  ORF type:complete len:416 (+),score=67.77 TRINITY_DN51563_c0_g1_i1:81-1250(+)
MAAFPAGGGAAPRSASGSRSPDPPSPAARERSPSPVGVPLWLDALSDFGIAAPAEARRLRELRSAAAAAAEKRRTRIAAQQQQPAALAAGSYFTKRRRGASPHGGRFQGAPDARLLLLCGAALRHALRWLDAEGLAACEGVCRRLLSAASDDSLWLAILRRAASGGAAPVGHSVTRSQLNGWPPGLSTPSAKWAVVMLRGVYCYGCGFVFLRGALHSRAGGQPHPLLGRAPAASTLCGRCCKALCADCGVLCCACNRRMCPDCGAPCGGCGRPACCLGGPPRAEGGAAPVACPRCRERGDAAARLRRLSRARRYSRSVSRAGDGEAPFLCPCSDSSLSSAPSSPAPLGADSSSDEGQAPAAGRASRVLLRRRRRCSIPQPGGPESAGHV